MAVNTEIYGSTDTWMDVPKTFGSIKAVNFSNGGDATVGNARVAVAIMNGKMEPATLLDNSIATHSIPSTLEGHTWNTMWDVGGVNAKGGPDNCILNKRYGNSPAIIYRVNSRSSGSGTECCPPIGGTNGYQWYNSPHIEIGSSSIDNWDVNRMCPVGAIDFKKFVFAIVLQVCADFTATEDAEGIKQVSSIPSSILIDFQAWKSDVIPSGQTKPYRELYPHICNVLLAPLYQSSGSEPTWDNFSMDVTEKNRLACIPNMLFDYTCAGWNPSTSRVTAANTGSAESESTVCWMDNMPISSSPIVYMMNASQINSLTTGSNSCTLFNLFGMKGGNGTSYGIAVQNYISSRNDRYFVRTCRGYSHLDWAYSSSSSDRRSIFAWWKDQPQYPTVVDPANPTPAETAAINAWRASITTAIHTMVAYTGAMFQDSVYGYNQNPTQRYIGIINADGIATGEVGVVTPDTFDEYLQTASDDFIDDTPYDPNFNPDAESSDPYTYPSSWRTGFGLFDRAYLMNNTQVEALAQWFRDCTNYALHPPTGVDPDEILKEYSNAAYGESPINAVVSLMSFPLPGYFLEASLVSDSNLHYLHIGTLMTNQVMGADVEGAAKPMGYKVQLGNGVIRINNLSSYSWTPFYNDFRDYAPYTTAELVIPYHGSCQLDPADWLGHDIRIDYIIDVRTGTSTALICRDGTPVKSLDGMIGIQIPMSGTDAASMINTQVQNAYNVRAAELQKSAAISDAVFSTAQAAMSGASGVQKVAGDLEATQGQIGMSIAGAAIGTMGAAAKGVNSIRSADLTLNRAKTELSHIPVSRMTVGSANSTCSVAMELRPRINIHRCRMVNGFDMADYGHTVGFACKLTGKVGQFSGYTECGDVDCSGITGATEEEKTMIHDALVGGTYL